MSSARRAIRRGFTIAAFTVDDLLGSAPAPEPYLEPIPSCPHRSAHAELNAEHTELVVRCKDCGAELKRAAAAPAT